MRTFFGILFLIFSLICLTWLVFLTVSGLPLGAGPLLAGLVALLTMYAGRKMISTGPTVACKLFGGLYLAFSLACFA